MENNSAEHDALAEYRSMNKKKYEDRMMKENEELEKERMQEELNEKLQNEYNYKQLQIEKDREYSMQYYNAINNINPSNNIQTNYGSVVLNNYTERLIGPSNYWYQENDATQSLLNNSEQPSAFHRTSNDSSLFGCKKNNPGFCQKTHRGILKYRQKKGKNEFITVSAILKSDTLELYKGSKLFDTIKLSEVIAPLEIFSTNSECLVANIINKDSVMLCCNTEECLNNWWIFITKQIICLNQGEMRIENDDTTIEEQQYNILNGENLDDIAIDIQDNLEDLTNGMTKKKTAT
ncbi:conserved Plasmodium protein, unknown function [Plasmodium chabaudi adami]|uniref:PH domain-containing protein n=1 Tax=Plasmodium chabaudi adami TaxID=5826 RepID=A0A1C6XIR7_PLACE|nr:conserved Plasmodium protein, unknown function [Plasmodium chabaudi adami]